MLRPYQNKAVKAIRHNYTAGIYRQLLCAATGTGKTVIFSHLPELTKDILPGQSMVLVHRDELAKQAIDKIQKANPNFSVQMEAGNNFASTDADVIVASVQTIGRKDSKRVDKFNWLNISRLIVDEAHHSIADSYMNVFNAGNYLHPDSKRLLLGVTATPSRGDGQGLASVYQTISYTYSLRQAIEDGWLVDVKGIRVNTKTSLDQVSTKHGDFDQKELADTVDNPVRNKLVAQAYVDNCLGRQAIGFGVNILHCQNLAKAFVEMGIKAESVWGDDPDRADKIKRFRDGEIRVLFNAQLLVEGFDLDTISCVILSAPTKSGVAFSQRVGRGTRLETGCQNLKWPSEKDYILSNKVKRDCIVLDVVDDTKRHRLVTLPTLLGMPSGLDLRGNSLVGSVKKIEELQELYPHLDFTTLKDIDKIQAFVEEVNLFEVHFPAEVEEHSDFVWHPSVSGGYVLNLPDKDSLTISQNLLDKYEIRASIKGKRYKGERASIEEAFSAADGLVMNISPESLKIVNRNSAWRSGPPSKKQMWRLKRLYKGKQIPPNLTSGSISNLISAAMAGKDKK